jgi:hypothetical protein
MRVHGLLKLMSKGNQDLYLTTHDALEDSDGYPELLTAPLNGLVHKGLPLKP